MLCLLFLSVCCPWDPLGRGHHVAEELQQRLEVVLVQVLPGQTTAHRKSTPQKSSWTFSGISQWTFSGIFQGSVTCQLYFPKGFHSSSGFPLDLSNGLSVTYFPMEFNSCEFRRVIFCPLVLGAGDLEAGEGLLYRLMLLVCLLCLVDILKKLVLLLLLLLLVLLVSRPVVTCAFLSFLGFVSKQKVYLPNTTCQNMLPV